MYYETRFKFVPPDPGITPWGYNNWDKKRALHDPNLCTFDPHVSMLLSCM